jgi:hypothetical protein
MDFTVNGTRTTITITKVVEKIEDGEVTLGKQTVRETTGCPSSEDGDSSVWYDYAAEALEQGARHKLQGGTTTVISDRTEIRTSWDSDLDVDFE